MLLFVQVPGLCSLGKGRNCNCSRRRQWYPTPVLLPGKSHGRKSLVGHGVTKSQTQLSDFTFTFHFHALEKETATHSSVLAWRIPGMAEPGGLPSMGSHRVRYDWSDLAAAAAAANKPCTFSSTQICTCKKQLTLRTLKWKISKFWKLPLFYPSP